MSYNCPDYRVSQDVSIANGILPATGTEKRPQNHYFDWAGRAAGLLVEWEGLPIPKGLLIGHAWFSCRQ